MRQRVEEITDGRGVDFVYDPIGGRYTEAALRATPWRGRLLVVGFANGEISKVLLNPALVTEREILGVYWGAAMRRNPAQHERNKRLLAEWFAAGKLKPAITERVPLSGAADAISRIAKRQTRGRVIMRPEAKD